VQSHSQAHRGRSGGKWEPFADKGMLIPLDIRFFFFPILESLGPHPPQPYRMGRANTVCMQPRSFHVVTRRFFGFNQIGRMDV